MRNKIKQLLKKEGGFTLVELLAVIAILGFIVAIAIPLVGDVIAKAEDKTVKQQEALVIDAAQMYFLQEENPGESVDIDTLQSKGYLEKKYDGKIEEVSKEQADNGTLETPTPEEE